jgi:pimeloyl-ACP methyl ester carboxylesterase
VFKSAAAQMVKGERMAATGPKSTMHTVQGMKIEVERMGKGKPILVFTSEEQLERGSAALANLALDHEVIMPSLPGYGRSERPDWIRNPDDISYIMMDLLDELHLGPVPVIGFSLGGWIVTEIATKSNAYFSKIILVDSYGVKVGGAYERDIADIWTLHADKVLKLKWHDVAKGKRDFPSMSEHDLQIIARNVESTARFCWEPYMHSINMTKRLHRIKVPTQFIWGENDGITPLAYGRGFSALILGSKFTTIGRAGHYPHLEQNDDFIKAIRPFLGA